MALPVDASMAPDCDLPDGYIVRFNALDPTTGAQVTGVVVEHVSIFGTLIGGGGGEAVGPFMLVPGPGA